MSANTTPASTPPADTGEVLAQLDPTRKDSITEADGAPPPPPVQARVRRAHFGNLPLALLRRFLDADVITQAAALAFYAALSLAPLMLLLLWLTASNPAIQQAVLAQVGQLAGPETEGVARAVERMLLRLAKQAPAIVCAQQADCSVPRGVAAFYAFKHGVGWHSAGKQFGAAFVGRHNHINRQGVVVGVGQANVRIVKRLNALLSQRRPAVACRANAAVRIAVAADWAGLRGGSASCQGSGKR